jgi:hypothetical protein
MAFGWWRSHENSLRKIKQRDADSSFKSIIGFELRPEWPARANSENPGDDANLPLRRSPLRRPLMYRTRSRTWRSVDGSAVILRSSISNSRHLIRRSLYSRPLDGLVMADVLSSHNATSCQNFAVESRRSKRFVTFALRSPTSAKDGKIREAVLSGP